MTGIQSPELLTDLYRDLRDRRLLPLALVLVVGIAVVPMALSSSAPSPAPPAAPVSSVAKKSSAPAVQVVAADPGLRDYRRRLHGDTPKDPFVQQFTAPSGLSAAQLTPSGGSSSSTGSSSSSTGSAGATSGASQSGGAATSAGAGEVTQPAPEVRTQTETKVVFYRLKLRTGQVGSELKVQDEVGPLGSLPGGSVRALAFIGATMNSDLNPKRAFFLVSNSATVVGGQSRCVVGSPCQILTLKVGQYVDVTWTDGLTYRVKLLKFRRHVRDRPPAQLGNETDTASTG
jgi:hypothetical protein